MPRLSDGMFIVLGIESLSFIINFGVVIVHFAVSVGLSGEGFLLLRCVCAACTPMPTILAPRDSEFECVGKAERGADEEIRMKQSWGW
jgi:hypothetical protein